jgi:hypothetical protein
MTMETLLEARIRRAKEAVGIAQSELDAVLADVTAVQRAHKQMISETLRTALDNVAAAHAALESIAGKT